MRRSLASLALACCSVALGSSVATAGVGPGEASVTVNPETAIEDASVTATFTGYACANNPVDLTITNSGSGVSSPLGQDPNSSAGQGQLEFTAPSAGNYVIEARFSNEFPTCDAVATAPLTVLAAPTTTIPEETTTTTVAPTTTQAAVVPPVPTNPPAGLPATGQASDVLVWLAIASVLLGAGFLTVSARRS